MKDIVPSHLRPAAQVPLSYLRHRRWNNDPRSLAIIAGVRSCANRVSKKASFKCLYGMFSAPSAAVLSVLCDLRFVVSEIKLLTRRGRRERRELLLFRRQKFLFDRSHHYIIRIDHFVQMNFRDLRKKLISIEFRQTVVLMNPRHQFGKCNPHAIV